MASDPGSTAPKRLGRDGIEPPQAASLWAFQGIAEEHHFRKMCPFPALRGERIIWL